MTSNCPEWRSSTTPSSTPAFPHSIQLRWIFNTNPFKTLFPIIVVQLQGIQKGNKPIYFQFARRQDWNSTHPVTQFKAIMETFKQATLKFISIGPFVRISIIGRIGFCSLVHPVRNKFSLHLPHAGWHACFRDTVGRLIARVWPCDRCLWFLIQLELFFPFN